MELFKEHSFSRCIGEGFNFLAKHLFLVSKVMLPYYTISSLVLVMYMAMHTKLSVQQQVYGEVQLDDYLWAVALFILLAIISLFANGRLILLFRRMCGIDQSPEGLTKMQLLRHTICKTSWLAWRSVPYLAFYYVLAFPGLPVIQTIAGLFASLSKGYAILVGTIAVMVILACIVADAPLLYSYFCRMMRPYHIDTTTPEGRLLAESYSLKASYQKGSRRKGKILGVALMATFIVTLASTVLLLPGIISIEAYFSSVEGNVNFHDNVTIPTGGYVLMILVGTMALALSNIISIIAQVALLCLFGDIYSAEK